MKVSWSHLLFAAVLAMAVPAVAAAEVQAPVAGGQDKAVLDDIDRTLSELSGHISVGSRRIRVKAPSGHRNAAAAEVPALVDLAVGKSINIDLPGDAREVIVGDPTITDVAISSRRRLFVLGRKAGRSNVFVLDRDGNMITRVDVTVGVDMEAVRAALKHALPNDNIDVRNEAGALIMMGSVTSDGAAGRAAAIARRFVDKDEQFVNLVKVSREQQVLIQVRVSEVQRNALKEVGVSASNLGSTKLFSANSLAGSTVARGLTSTNPAGTLTFTGIADILATLTLLESRGLMRSLAEPNLVAVSGETASMLAGGEYPVPVPDQDGIKIEYKPFGVTLTFLPVVLDSGRISLKLTTEVSALSAEKVAVGTNNQGTLSVSSFVVRRASSTVELPNGGSLMIAGLIQNDQLSGLSGLPGLMDLPVFGQLFRSDSFKRNETELVVVVNAQLVRPTARASLVSPTDTIAPGGDLDIWAFGKLTGRYSPGFVNDQPGRSRAMPMFGFTLDEIVP